MKKRIVALLIAGTMALSLSACGNDSKSTSEPQKQEETSTDEQEAKEAQATIDAQYNPNNIAPSDYSNVDEYLAAWINGVEPNTFDMVDTIAHAAKAEANYNGGNSAEALSYISSNYPNYFTDNAMMEKTMFYGYYLEYANAKNGYNVSDHFANVGKIVKAGATTKDIGDIELSRYACYLIVQNGDSRKKVIALGQTYFAVKTRQQELIENFDNLTEEKKRLAIRGEMISHNKSLAEAAKMAGISDPRDYAIFQNKGYKGLYGGLGVKEIHARKGLKKSQKILDHMGSTELAANLFRATQTDEKLRRDHITGKEEANQTHFDVGKKVRQTIKDLGGTMPEDLPTPKKSIKQIEREQRNLKE